MRVPSIIGITGVVVAGCLAGLAVAAPRVSSPHDAAVELSAASQYRVTLRTASGFVSADHGGGADVVTDKAKAGTWETFTLSDVDGGSLVSGDKVYLGTVNGHYLSATYGGGLDVNATEPHHLSWETFEVVSGPAGTAITNGARVALRTTVRPRWVTSGNGTLDATAEKYPKSALLTLGLGVAAPAPTPTASPSGPAAAPTTPVAVAPTTTKAPAPASGPFVEPEPGQTTGPGRLPATVDHYDALGSQQTDTPGVSTPGFTGITRDLGFSGVLNGQSVWTFGDTLIDKPDGSQMITAYDSVALGDTANPLLVHDRNVTPDGWPTNWIPLDAQEQAGGGVSRYAEGGTNVVEYAPNKGVVYFLKNDRGSNGKGILGAGVATATADANGAVATRTMDTMWGPDEPRWGDVGAAYDPRDGKIYVFGGGPGSLDGGVYLARVPAAQATDVGAYEYWDDAARTWGTQRVSDDGAGGTRRITTDQAVFKNRAEGQSTPFWSNYYNAWMFLGGAGVSYSDIMVTTAPNLWGPWTTPKTVAPTCHQVPPCGGMEYAMTAHPEYDPTGRTVLVTYTDFPKDIKAVRITWK